MSQVVSKWTHKQWFALTDALKQGNLGLEGQHRPLAPAQGSFLCFSQENYLDLGKPEIFLTHDLPICDWISTYIKALFRHGFFGVLADAHSCAKIKIHSEQNRSKLRFFSPPAVGSVCGKLTWPSRRGWFPLKQSIQQTPCGKVSTFCLSANAQEKGGFQRAA